MSLFSLSTIFEAFPLDPCSMLCFARNDKGEKSKEAQLIFSWGHLDWKWTQTTEVRGF